MIRMMAGSSLRRPRYPLASIFQFFKRAMQCSILARRLAIVLLNFFSQSARGRLGVFLIGVVAVVALWALSAIHAAFASARRSLQPHSWITLASWRAPGNGAETTREVTPVSGGDLDASALHPCVSRSGSPRPARLLGGSPSGSVGDLRSAGADPPRSLRSGRHW